MQSQQPHTKTFRHRRFHKAALGIVFLLLGVVVTGTREQPPVQSVRFVLSSAFETAFQNTP